VKRFEFSLARLGRLRGALRREAEGALRLAQARVADCGRLRERLEGAELPAVERGWREAAGRESAEPGNLVRAADDLEFVRAALRSARAAERAALEVAAAAGRVATERRREHRVVQKLEERARRRWLGEVASEE
jgi:hypothetical protein